jgi:Asp-tRNA(Asn)/Glu-tRNA(Gln) amidotransferase A subunit family amidase
MVKFKTFSQQDGRMLYTTHMSSLTELQALDPITVAENAFDHANSNAGKNVYLAMDREKTLAEAKGLATRFPQSERPILFGAPVAVKDCFDVAGYPTTCGSHYYAEQHGVAAADSSVAARLRQAGAVIMGKTHLHQLAYGITGQNSEYGDCVQPRNAQWFTGGSSSGSAASVQEGSSVAAIGTDTGGSIRVPAALCGLAGYRSTLGLGGEQMWNGGVHLASSFDTIGWLFRDLRDGPALGAALFGLPIVDAPLQVSIAAVGDEFVRDCEPAVLAVYRGVQQKLRRHGADISTFEPDFWDDSREIFLAIQGHEASELHRGNFEHYEKPIAERLAWGASFSPEEIVAFRERHAAFRHRLDRFFQEFDFLLVPCAPVSELMVGMDHTTTRPKLLRYTTPASLGGTPVVALTAPGGGVQLIGARGSDARLLAYAARLGEDA